MRKIVTIGREFGAGGGEIGRRVAKELGIEYYDKDIILKTAVSGKGLSPEQVRRWDERVPKNFGFAQSLFDFYNKPLEEELWQAQRDAIRELEENTGKTYEKLYIVGGGAKNALLNQLTAQATGKEVIALPIEATALGNLNIQMEVK